MESVRREALPNNSASDNDKKEKAGSHCSKGPLQPLEEAFTDTPAGFRGSPQCWPPGTDALMHTQT